MANQFCQECGAQAPAEQRFCRECGAELALSVPAGARPESSPLPQTAFALNKKSGGTLWFALGGLLLFGILVAFAIPSAHRNIPHARKNACISNMKTIQGAAELYLLEHENAKMVTIGEFLEQEYLKSEPQCPGLGKYTIQVHPPAPGEKYRRITILCSVHREIDDTTAGL